LHTQDVCATRSWYCPALQAMQPWLNTRVPGPQMTISHSAEAARLFVFAGHFKHEAAPSEAWCVLVGHAVHTRADGPLKRPRWQFLQV